MAILFHIKSVHKTTLELHFLNLETTFYFSIIKVRETKVVSDFKIYHINIIWNTFF